MHSPVPLIEIREFIEVIGIASFDQWTWPSKAAFQPDALLIER
jgi:hypothetical protein